MVFGFCRCARGSGDVRRRVRVVARGGCYRLLHSCAARESRGRGDGATAGIGKRVKDRQFGFHLDAYFPLLMSFLPLVAAGMTGTVVGFLLLDQRDDHTMTALLVTPLSLGDYLRYRVGVLMVVSAVFGAAITPLAGLSETTPLQIGVAAVTAAPLAPIYALFLGTFAANKVQGFALAKVVGVVFIP